jgi:hypothetical protein
MSIIHIILGKITGFLLWMISSEEGRNFMLISSYMLLFFVVMTASIMLSMSDEDDGRY